MKQLVPPEPIKRKPQPTVSYDEFNTVCKDLENDFILFGENTVLFEFTQDFKRVYKTFIMKHKREEKLLEKIRELVGEKKKYEHELEDKKKQIRFYQKKQSHMDVRSSEMVKKIKLLDLATNAKLKELRMIEREISEMKDIFRINLESNKEHTKLRDILVKEKEQKVHEFTVLEYNYSSTLTKYNFVIEKRNKVRGEYNQSSKELQKTRDTFLQLQTQIKKFENDKIYMNEAEKQILHDIEKFESDVNELKEKKEELIKKNKLMKRMNIKEEQEFEKLKNKLSLIMENKKKIIESNSHIKRKLKNAKLKLQKKVQSNANLDVTFQKVKGKVRDLKVTNSNLLIVYKKVLRRKNELLTQKERDKRTNDGMHEELNNYKILFENTENRLSDLSYQKKVLGRNMKQNESIQRRKEAFLKINKNSQSKYLTTIERMKKKTNLKRKSMFSLERENIKFTRIMNNVNFKTYRAQESIDVKKSKMDLYKKTREGLKREIKVMKIKIEHLENEKNEVSNETVGKTKELKNLKEKIKMLRGKIKRTKTENETFDKKILKEKNKLTREKNLSKQLEALIKSFEKKMRNEKNKVIQDTIEIQKLMKVLGVTQKKMIESKKALSQTSYDREVVGKKYVQSVNALGNIADELQRQAIMLTNGKVEFNKIDVNVRVLNLEIKEAKKKLKKLKEENSNISKYKMELIQLTKLITQTKIKMSTLEREKMKTVNIHSLKLLPKEEMKLINTYWDCKKNFIEKGNKIVKLNTLIKQKQKLYKDLRVIMKTNGNPQKHLNDKIFIFKTAWKKRKMENGKLKKKLNNKMNRLKELEEQTNYLNGEIKEYEKKFLKKIKLLERESEVM